MDNIHVCTPAVLSWDEQVKAAGVSLKETITNAFVNPSVLSDAIGGGFEPSPMRGVLLKGKWWGNNRTITIGFLDGDPGLQERIKAQANTWLNYIGIKFAWTTNAAAADIRITMTRGGSWSYIGTDNLVIAKPKPTMQFGWLTVNSSDAEIRSVVLHEFGHMLGLGHEQAHPFSSIPWNKPVVYDYYARTQGWNTVTVDSQVFFVYDTGATNYSAYDKYSIMHYSIPREHLLDASRAVPFNQNLSATDIQFIKSQYPMPTVVQKRDWEVYGWYECQAYRKMAYRTPGHMGSGEYKTYGWYELHGDKSVTRFGPKGEF